MSAPEILLGVTGGIAAYKAAEIVRGLRRAGAGVTVLMTRSAGEFIAPLTLQVLSGRPVHSDQYDLSQGADVEHVTLVRRADVLVIAPATANVIAKLSRGLADDLLSTLATAATCPLVVAPAMNSRMWAHAAVQENLRTLRDRGATVIDPTEGDLACGEEGPGRLAEPAAIVQETLRLADRGRSLEGERVLVTAGPTREPVDPVRFLSNRSSGKMGYAIAAAARRRGAEVVLVSGPVALGAPWGVERVFVETSAEMAREVSARFDWCTACIMAAAVSDYRPAQPEPAKVRRSQQGWRLALEPTEDILASLAARRGSRLIVGFAAETGDPEEAALRKLRAKDLDFIFGNDVTRPGAGFDAETNALVGLDRDGGRREFPMESKTVLAGRLLDWMDERKPAVSAVRARTGAREGGSGR